MSRASAHRLWLRGGRSQAARNGVNLSTCKMGMEHPRACIGGVGIRGAGPKTSVVGACHGKNT
eukprot:1204995-Lingulodinium_polyedra.AAC.1